MNEQKLEYIGNVLHSIELLLRVIAGVNTVEQYYEERRKEYIDKYIDEEL